MNSDKKGISLLTVFVRDNKPETVKSLLKTGHYDVDERDYINDQRTLLITASYEGFTEVVRILLHHGANVNLFDDLGRTALMQTCFKGHYEIAEELLNNGAFVNMQSTTGYTALIAAAGNGHNEIVSLLFDRGAILDLHNNRGRTALYGRDEQASTVHS